MLVVPALTAVANPLELMVAVVIVVEFQVTDDVMSCFVPSVYTPVAVN